MLERIEAEGGDAQKFVERAKDKKDNSRLMGFGHRVYKNYDPRAAILKQAVHRGAAARSASQSRLLEIAMKLEEIALKDDYFISHKLYPNVDFYSGIIYKALGIPVNMFTVMFAIGRCRAGSRSGSRCGRTPTTASRGRARSTPARPQRAYLPLDRR